MNIDKAVDALKLALNQAINGKGAKPKAKKNERGDEGDARQIIADLISREESPFLPDDEQGLRSMTTETLKKMRDFHLSSEEGEDEEPETPEAQEETTEEETPEGNEGEEGDEDEEAAPAAQKKGKVMTKAAPKPVLATFSKEDRAALLHARKLVDARKAELIEKITGNTAITKDQANAMDLATLEVVAAGIRPEANYSGRAMPVNAEDATDAGKAMVAPSVSDMIVNRNKKVA